MYIIIFPPETQILLNFVMIVMNPSFSCKEDFRIPSIYLNG